jgi:hypothetical protein
MAQHFQPVGHCTEEPAGTKTGGEEADNRFHALKVASALILCRESNLNWWGRPAKKTLEIMSLEASYLCRFAPENIFNIQ